MQPGCWQGAQTLLEHCYCQRLCLLTLMLQKPTACNAALARQSLQQRKQQCLLLHELLGDAAHHAVLAV
jgi:hypothetical protein